MFTNGSVFLELVPRMFLRSLGVIVMTDDFSVRVTKIAARIGVS